MGASNAGDDGAVTPNAVRSKDVQLEAAGRIVEVVDELVAISGGSVTRPWDAYLRKLAQLARQALDDPGLLDDDEGRADFASALRKSLPWGSGFGSWDDWNAPPPNAGRSYELKERLAQLVHST